MTSLADFLERHSINESSAEDSVAVAVEVLGRMYGSVMEYMDTCEPPSPRHQFLAHAYTNLIARLHEQAEGMLVCLATRNGPSAEALARVVLEGAINLMYMLKNDREKTFLAYCEAWFVSHERQLDQWLEIEKELNTDNGTVNMVLSRLSLIKDQRALFDRIISEFKMQPESNFRDACPKSLFKKFSFLGKEREYLTSYHRLSSSSHILAEDTISWMLGVLMDDDTLRLKLGEEAVAYSQMMCLIVMVPTLEAITTFAIAHNHLSSVDQFKECYRKLAPEIEKLAVSAGVPTN